MQIKQSWLKPWTGLLYFVLAMDQSESHPERNRHLVRLSLEG